MLQPGERILKQEHGVLWIASWISRHVGTLVFTTQRLYLDLPRPVEIPRDALVSVERLEKRKNVYLVVRTEYEQLKLVTQDPKAWEATLRQAMHDDKTAVEALLDRLKPKPIPPPYR